MKIILVILLAFAPMILIKSKFFESKVTSFQNLEEGTILSGVLMNDILIWDSRKPQPVVVKLLKDVYDPKTNQLLVAKNTILNGKAASFDSELGQADVYVKAILGDKTLTLKVGTSERISRLQGEIRSVGDKTMLAEYINEFADGALDFIAKNTNDDMTDSLVGAELLGQAKVYKAIAGMNLKVAANSHKVFYIPSGVKVMMRQI